jgi:hypothetical protein
MLISRHPHQLHTTNTAAMMSLSTRPKRDDKERSLRSSLSRISLTSTLTGEDDSYSFADSLACHSSSRMERIADHESSKSSFPMMPRRINSVCVGAQGGSALNISEDSTPPSSKENAFHRLPLKRVSPLSRQEYVIDMKPSALYSNGSPSSPMSTSIASPEPPKEKYPVLAAQRDPRREYIFGPPSMPKRSRSIKNLNHDEHADGLSCPSTPRSAQGKSTLIVKRREGSYNHDAVLPHGDDRHDHHQEEKQEEQAQDCSIMIEVAPGVKLPLRGSAETWSAIEEGSVTVSMCVCCNMDLNCILDAQLVICPDCLCVSPVDQTEQDSTSSASMHRHGVGVGIKGEEILRWVMSNSE